MDNMRTGYAEAGRGVSARMRERTRYWADQYREDPAMEAALALRDADPAAYRSLGVSVHLALGYYLQAKTAFESLRGEGEDRHGQG